MFAAMYGPAHKLTRASWLAAWAAAVLCVTAPAHATDIWSAPYPGVRLLHRVGNGRDLHVILADLSNPQVSLIATRPGDRMITVSEFARRYETEIAVNANFFDRGSCGLMAGDGELMDHAYDDNCTASIAFGRDNEAAVFDSLPIARGPLPAAWMTDVLSGKPFLIRNGRPMINWVRPQHLYRPNPRTALGLTADRRTLVILIADGRRGDVAGLTGFEMVQIFRGFDVTDAVNLDGGGSTELVMDGRIRNHPSDRRERPVMSHLGIRIRPGDRWQAAEIVAYGAPSAATAGETTSVWLEARNVGRTTWRPEQEGGTSPVLEMEDGTVSYLATVAEATPPGEVARFELGWLARGGGERHLHARLRAPDGEVLDDAPLSWTVAVDPQEHAPSILPQRAVAIARASEVNLPGGLGAVFVGSRGCSAAPGSQGTAWPGWFAIAAGLALTRVRRKRVG